MLNRKAVWPPFAMVYEWERAFYISTRVLPPILLYEMYHDKKTLRENTRSPLIIFNTNVLFFPL